MNKNSREQLIVLKRLEVYDSRETVAISTFFVSIFESPVEDATRRGAYAIHAAGNTKS